MKFLPFRPGGVPFNPSTDIPSLKNKIILVTGGTSGLGKQSIVEFARHEPAEIWLAARSPSKAKATINDVLTQIPGAPIKFVELDLASLESVRKAAELFLEQTSRLDILLLNAGIMGVLPGLTEDGFEVHFGTNHMGHALLTKMLSPTLVATAKLPAADVRVVVVTSAGLNWAPPGGIQFDLLKTTATQLSKSQRYGQSKLANALFARELAKRHPQLTVASVHPGVVYTNLAAPAMEQSALLRMVLPAISSLILPGPTIGAKNQLWASVSEDVKSGEYYEPIGIAGRGKASVKSNELAAKLWDWTEHELRKCSSHWEFQLT